MSRLQCWLEIWLKSLLCQAEQGFRPACIKFACPYIHTFSVFLSPLLRKYSGLKIKRRKSKMSETQKLLQEGLQPPPAVPSVVTNTQAPPAHTNYPANKRRQPSMHLLISCRQSPDQNTCTKALSCGCWPEGHLLLSLCPKHVVTLAGACLALFTVSHCCASFPGQLR